VKIETISLVNLTISYKKRIFALVGSQTWYLDIKSQHINEKKTILNVSKNHKR